MTDLFKDMPFSQESDSVMSVANLSCFILFSEPAPISYDIISIYCYSYGHSFDKSLGWLIVRFNSPHSRSYWRIRKETYNPRESRYPPVTVTNKLTHRAVICYFVTFWKERNLRSHCQRCISRHSFSTPKCERHSSRNNLCPRPLSIYILPQTWQALSRTRDRSLIVIPTTNLVNELTYIISPARGPYKRFHRWRSDIPMLRAHVNSIL